MTTGSPSLIGLTGSLVLGAALGAPAIGASNGAVSNPYPFSPGDTFTYAYTSTHSEVPVGKPETKTITTGTLTTTIGSTKKFNGKSSTDVNQVLDYQSKDTQGTTISGTTTTDDYSTFLPRNGGLNYVRYGDTVSGNYTSSTGETETSSSTETYGQPFLIDIIPELKGTFWFPEIAYTMPSQTSTTLNGVTTGTTQTYTRNEVGAYTRTLKRTETGDPEYDETDTQSAGGSGKDENNGTGSTGGTTTFSAPSYIKGRYAITVVYTPTSGTPTTTVVPDWFPGNGLPGPLATEQRSDVGKAIVPKECGATAGQTAVELQDTVADLDVVRGTYSETHMQQWVVAGEGRVCTYSTELINTYDNRVTGDLLVSERFSTLTALTSESLGQILRGRT